MLENKPEDTTGSKTEKMHHIRDEIIALTDSPLYTYRTENHFLPVIGEGSHDAKIMFVGEAPGRNEAKTGWPFCGAAGKVLDTLLASVGIPRTEIYITNIVKDRPPENRDPTAKEIEVYGPFLDRQIDIIKPQIIVTLGRYAMGYVMGQYGLSAQLETISRAHGKIYQGAHKSAFTFDIATLYHPCVAVYNSSKLPILIEDFKILKKYYAGIS